MLLSNEVKLPPNCTGAPGWLFPATGTMVSGVTEETEVTAAPAEEEVVAVEAEGTVREHLAFLRLLPPTGMSQRVPPWVQ